MGRESKESRLAKENPQTSAKQEMDKRGKMKRESKSWLGGGRNASAAKEVRRSSLSGVIARNTRA